MRHVGCLQELYRDTRSAELKRRKKCISLYFRLTVFLDIKQDRKISGPNVSKQLRNVNKQHAHFLN